MRSLFLRSLSMRPLSVVAAAILLFLSLSWSRNAAGQSAPRSEEGSKEAGSSRLASEVPYRPEAVPASIQPMLDQAVGKSVYSCYRTGVLLVDAQERAGHTTLYYGAPANPSLLRYMAPWKVLAIDELGDQAGWAFFGLRVSVNGVTMVVNGIAVSPVELERSSDLLQTLADKAHLFTSAEASGIHFTDLGAVEAGEVHPGMSEQEVECALGAPEGVNSVGSDVAQSKDAQEAKEIKEVYDGGRILVYLKGGSVVDVQHVAPAFEERAAR